MSARKTLYMETTEISPVRTAAEITTLLVSAGARAIAMSYSQQGTLTGLEFTLDVQGHSLSYALPVRIDPVYNVLVNRTKKSWLSDREKATKRQQAERVAWRQLLRWIQAQLAMIDTGMVSAGEVFLPYVLHGATRQTLFEYFSGEGLNLLAAPAAK